MSWLRVSDLLLLTPGWQRSAGCRAELNQWRADRCREPFDANDLHADELPQWIEGWSALFRRHPRVYVAGPYLTGVDGPHDGRLFYRALLLALSCDMHTPSVHGTNAWRLATNILNGLDWCKRVLDAGGYPYCPWADALLVIASPSAMSCTCESDEGYCSLHGPSLQQQRIDAFPSIFG